MRDFLLRARVAVRSSNMKISRCRLADHIKKFTPKSALHVQHDYFFSFNQSNHWFVALQLPLPSSNLPTKALTAEAYLSPQRRQKLGACERPEMEAGL